MLWEARHTFIFTCLSQVTYVIFFCTLRKKMKFSIKDFFSKCGQIRRKMRIWSHLLKKSLTKNFIFWAV